MSDEIKKLQQYLAELGFKLVGPPTGEINLRTEMAVREFQRYAKLPVVARENMSAENYVDRLSPAAVPLENRYSGHIHGLLDEATKKAIEHWKTSELRCPLVVQAWEIKGGKPVKVIKGADNLWLHDDKADLIRDTPKRKVRVFARDFSQSYPIPAEYTDPDINMIVLGYYQPSKNKKLGGPRSIAPNHTRPVSEILPENLIGKPFDDLTDAEKSTFRVVRASSELECEGFYDSLNCSDNAFVSLGPCHWTLGILDLDSASGAVDKGELGAYFAYLAEAEPSAFQDALGRWGIAFEDWGINGSGLLDGLGRKKYISTIKQQTEDGTFEGVPRDATHWNFFKTWHWFYRFQASCRSIEGFRRRMWDMARIRLRDILDAPWKPGALPQEWGPQKIKDIFNSELAIAMLLRWHIFRPGHVIDGGMTSDRLTAIFKLANIPKPAGSPDHWKQCLQNHLIRAILEYVRSRPKAQGLEDLSKGLNDIARFPIWAKGKNPREYVLTPTIGKLSRVPDSFLFDAEGLPPAPPFENVPGPEFNELVLAAESTPEEEILRVKRVVSTYIGNREIFRVVSDGTTLTGSWLDNVTAADKKKIDRVIFFKANENDTEALWVLPVVINKKQNDDDHLKIEIENEGKPKAILKIGGKYRCFSVRSGEEALKLEIVINHVKVEGQPKVFFKKVGLDLDKKENFPLEDLPAKEFTRKSDGGFEMSKMGRKIGLYGTRIDNSYTLTQKLRFIENKSFDQRNPIPGVVMSIETQVGLVHSSDPNQKLIPFNLSFSWQEVASVKNANGNIWYFVTITQRQPFGESWEKIREGETHWIFETTFPHSAALERWNESVELPVRESLHVVQDGRPVTFLPTFEDDEAKGKLWRAKFSVIDRDRKKDLEEDRIKFPSELQGALKNDQVLVFGRLISPDSAAGHRIEAELKGFSTMEGSPVAFTTVIKGLLEDEKETEFLETVNDVSRGNINPGFYFRLDQTIVGGAAVKPQGVRVGSLNLEFYPPGGEQGAPTDPENTETDLLVRAGFDDRYNKQTPPLITLRSARYRLAMTGIAPGGQDSVPGEEFFTDLGDDIDATDEYRRRFIRDLALIIDLDKKSEAAAIPVSPAFFLTVEERIEPHKSQTIALQIKSQAESERRTRSVIVIDPHPFLICKVSIDEFQNALSEGITNEIGNWTNRADVGAGWEVSAGAEGFGLILPPQTVGEAMHRSKDAGDITPGKPIDFRFSPPAQARLRPSFYKQRFAEVPWNLRRILGYVGQRSPGAGVDKIDFELFYGMPGQITYPFLRLAEIGSRLGANPGQQYRRLPWKHNNAQKNQYEKFRDFWRDIFPSLMSRLAILEPWDANQLKTLILSDKDGLSYELRRNANLRYPIRDVDPPPGFNFDPTGLTGGYSWGFESNNVFRAVLRTPVSFGAQITRPLFSSLGGWGQQKALFDQGLTTISNETVMGRVSSINIERIGRISVFWNKAKHVIVYERTVVPSRQFFMEQEQLIGNPILRKVDEYIELLEDDRPFPDNESFSKAARGCVMGCRFPSGKPPRIRVNSRWGQDIGSIGWKVPLWVRGAAPADIYPKPDIKLMMAGKIEGERVPSALDDPEKLFFFTLTTPDADRETDNWPAIEGVDFGAVDKDLNPPPVGGAKDDPDNIKVVDVPVVGGKGAFTLALAPAPAPVNVMVDRVSEAITARLYNVTVMRGFAEKAEGSSNTREVLTLRDDLTNKFSPILSVLPANNSPIGGGGLAGTGEAGADPLSGLISDLKNGITGTRTLFTDLHNKISSGGIEFEEGIKKDITQRLTQLFKFAEAQIRVETENVLGEFKHQFGDILKEVNADLPDFSEAKALLTSRLDELAGEGSELKELIQGIHGTVGEITGKLKRTFSDLDRITALTHSKIEDSKCEICEITEWGPAAQPRVEAILRKTRSEAEEVLRRVDFLVAEIPRQWIGNRTDNIRPGLLDNRIKIEQAAGTLYYQSFKLDIVEQPTIGTDLDALETAVFGLIDGARVELEKWLQVLEGLNTEKFDDLLDNFADRIREWIENLSNWDDMFTAADNVAREVFGKLPQDLDRKIGALRKSFEDQAGILRETFLPKLSDLKNSINKVLDPALADNIKKLFEGIDPLSAQLREEVERIYSRSLESINEYINRAAISFPLTNPIPILSEDNALRLLRGFGEPPKLPDLGFSLPSLGYYPFGDIDLKKGLKELTEIGLTPVIAQANRILQDAVGQARDLLNPLEIKLPTRSLLDRFKPIDLKDFDLSKVFPNFAGLKLDGLFPSLKMPSMSSDRVKVTHGINPETRSGWMKVKVDVPFEGQPVTVFSMAGVNLRLLQARFEAEIQIESAEGQPPRQMVKGSITGDWDLQVGGFPVAVFAKCSLIFEEGGKIRFDISPDRVKLQQVLAFLSDLIKKFGYSDQGFSVAITPTGIRTVLDLPLPDVQAGAFGIANLNLGLAFGIEIPGEFRLSTQLSVGRRDAPFTLTIFILGGAGYFELDVSYTPRTKALSSTVNIGIFAAASLAIALGPIKGGIYAYFGITVQYTASSHSAGRLTIGLLLLFRGEVRVLGIVTVSLTLALEALYTPGGGLVGRGRVSLKIKICWCITISVSAQVEYRFGKKAGSEALAAPAPEAFLLGSPEEVENAVDPYKEAATNYISMFG